jgi:hypothetical protein
VKAPAPVHAALVDNEDGTYDLTFKPTVAGRYSLTVTLENAEVPATKDVVGPAETGLQDIARRLLKHCSKHPSTSCQA